MKFHLLVASVFDMANGLIPAFAKVYQYALVEGIYTIIINRAIHIS